MAAFRIHDARRLSHAYILSASDRAECLNLAGQIAAAAVCQRGTDAPCGQCRDCRKAQNGIHPDILHIRRELNSKGEARGEIVVDQIRAMTADACVLPNEAARKVYIVDDADKMNPQAQNAALKTLEEPPAGVIFLLCVENAGALLPTVRSRCVEMGFNAEHAEEDEGSRKLAKEYLQLAARGDEAAVCRWCMKNERMERAEAETFLAALQTLLADRLAGRRDEPPMDRAQLWTLQRLVERCSVYWKANVSVRQIFGLLAVRAVSGGNRG